MTEPKYTKVQVTESVDEDTSKITTSSYTDHLKNYKEEIEHTLLTTHNGLLNDVLKSLRIIKDTNTPELIITISMDKYGNPMRLTQRYTVDKQYYGK